MPVSSSLAAGTVASVWSETGEAAPALPLEQAPPADRAEPGEGAGAPVSQTLSAVGTPPNGPAPAHELIVGGQRSGKSRRAEQLAKAWLAQNAQSVPSTPAGHLAHAGQGDGRGLRFGATFIATAQALDADMQARIARHRADRAEQLPEMGCVEEPLNLAQAVLASAAAHDARHLLVIDCLTLWLSNLMHAHGAFAEMPDAPEAPGRDPAPWLQALHTHTQALVQALAVCRGPVVLVSNEVGLGLTPLGREVRAYVDELGRLNQQVAQGCTRVCLMVAGQALMVKGG